MIEQWKPVVGNENYLVSNTGKIKNGQGDILLGSDDGRGYIRVCLNYKLKRLHRVVATAFLVNKENKSEVNHIDGNKKNNCVENLEWSTRKENMAHAFSNKLCVNGFGEKSARSILTADQVKYIRDNCKPRSKEFSQTALGRKFGVTNSTVWRVLNNDSWVGQ
mgnify:CR=1 FL=1